LRILFLIICAFSYYVFADTVGFHKHLISIGINEKQFDENNLDQDSLLADFFIMKASKYTNNHPDSTHYYLAIAKEIIEDNNFKNFYPRYYANYGNFYGGNSVYDSAIYYYNKSIEYQNEYPDVAAHSLAATNIAVINYYKEEKDELLRTSFYAIDLNEKFDTPKYHIRNSSLWMNLTYFYLNEKDTAKALEASYNAVRSSEKSKHFIDIPSVKTMHASMLLYTDNLEEAGMLFDTLLVIADTIYFKKVAADIYLHYTEYCIKTGKYKDALEYAYLAKNTETDYHTLHDSIEIEMAIAVGKYYNNKKVEGKKLLKDLLNVESDRFMLETKISILRQLLEFAEIEKNPDDLINTYKKLDFYEDSLESIQNKELIAKYEVELDTRKKEIALQRAKAENRKAIMKNWIILISSIFAGIIFIVIFITNRQKNILKIESIKNKAKIEKNKLEKELFERTKSEAEKKELLEQLQQKIAMLESENINMSEMLNIVDNWSPDISNGISLDEFELRFNELFPEFYPKLISNFPELNSNQLRILALIKMKFNSKDIGSFLSISPGFVNNQRSVIRKIMNIDKNSSLFAETQKF
jgi:hypothetical protein